ncbi:MAG: DNA polymerase III subunit gamma/tau [Saprospiraceae bacterium]|nr:MAG: DNA polymerase III subunit gamma/tau [Saprospiraceae bacterium]
MSYVVSARKYRPQRFDDIVGQSHVSQTLKKALQSGHLAHAFLFCGPRGVGKTSCARILAKALNCRNLTADHEPCGTCDSCISFDENASFNIMELDAASNNSVDHIRSLVEQVRFQPQQGRYKVFIIDEVHMLSSSAFNAFLKTLEEPPPYAVFILATTEKHKIIPTILSRCQTFDFKRIQVKDITAHLEKICKEEKIKAEKEALHVIAVKADGALRDALSIFDQMVSSSNKNITYAGVITNLNILDYSYYFRFTEAILTQDLAQVMLIFDEVLRNGFDGDLFINGLAEHLRDLLVCKDEGLRILLEVSDSLKERYYQLSELAPASFLLTALNICNDCDVNYKMARDKRLHVELALIKMCYITQAIQLATRNKPAPLPEKKTPDVTAAPPVPSKTAPPLPTPAAPAQDPLPEKEVASVSAETPVPEVVEKVEEPAWPGYDEKPAPNAEEISKVPSPGKSKVSNLPKLQTLTDLRAEVEEAETNGTKKMENLTQESLEAAWQAYLESSSRDSVKIVLKNASAQIAGKAIVVRVGSALAENTIRQESALMEFLRERMQAPRLSMKIKIDTSMAPVTKAPAKPLTDSEKYWGMKSINPLVDEVRKRFDLQIDNG